MAKRIGALHYFECSAKTGEGVAEIFDYVAKVAYKLKDRRRSKNGDCKFV